MNIRYECGVCMELYDDVIEADYCCPSQRVYCCDKCDRVFEDEIICEGHEGWCNE